MIVLEFNPDTIERIPRDPVERVAYELWSMQHNDDRSWADHMRQLARAHGSEGCRIDASAYVPLEWPPA